MSLKPLMLTAQREGLQRDDLQIEGLLNALVLWRHKCGS